MPPHSDTNNNEYGNILESWLGNRGDILCTNMTLEKAQCRPQVPAPSTRRHSAPPKAVSFYPEVEIFEIPSVKDFSRRDVKALYMSRDEMASIHQECWEIVDLMNLGIEYAEERDFSKRGLVDLKDDCVERRRRLREEAYRIVFGVQAFNQSRKITGEPLIDVTDLLAELYHKSALPSQREAYRTARFDSIAAGTAWIHNTQIKIHTHTHTIRTYSICDGWNN